MTLVVDQSSVWRLAQQCGAQLAAFMRPTIEHYSSETELGGWTWLVLVRMYTFANGGVSIEQITAYDPYSNEEFYRRHLQQGANAGYLDVDAGCYGLTVSGRAAIKIFIDDLRATMAAIDPLAPDAGSTLARGLGELVDAARARPVSGPSGALEHSYALMPGVVPPLPYSEQAISCLAAYRDDTHLGAWIPSGLSGPAMEALTLLWRRQGDSLETLHKQLVRRQHTRQVYRQALQELREKEYITGSDGAPVITNTGLTFRQMVEEETDRQFFAPWYDLSAETLEQMAVLLSALHDGLQAEHV